jgi:hypothetical protein
MADAEFSTAAKGTDMTAGTKVICHTALEFARCGNCGQLRRKSDIECPLCHEGSPAPHFYRDLDALNEAFQQAGAVMTFGDGWQGIDESSVHPDLLDAYRSLLRYGYTNGLLPGELLDAAEIEEARAWLAELHWADDPDLAALSAEQVRRAIDRYYDGGLGGFLQDGPAVNGRANNGHVTGDIHPSGRLSRYLTRENVGPPSPGRADRSGAE